MVRTGRSAASTALLKVIAVLIAVAAAAIGTTAAVASGWTFAESESA